MQSGELFTLKPDGTGYSVLHVFPPLGQEETAPPLALGADGNLYGVMQGLAFALHFDGIGSPILRTFEVGPIPNRIILGGDGVLYGTTTGDGITNWGTVFRVKTDGTGYTVLYRFAKSGAYAGPPIGFLAWGGDGALYGATLSAVFRMNPDGSNYSLVYNFHRGGTTSLGAPFQGTDGAFYWPDFVDALGHGTLYRLPTNGTGYTIQFAFTNSPADGQFPSQIVAQGSDLAFYGTTCCAGRHADGSVFRVAADGTGYTNLYSFGSFPTDGRNAEPAFLVSGDGVLFGVTGSGGSANFGSIFRIGEDGAAYAQLRSLNPTGGDGAFPWVGLIRGLDGTLYGTTSASGAFRGGTLFRLAPDGSSYGLLHSFDPYNHDGLQPLGAVVQATDGALYGTTSSGGTNGSGTVFRVRLDGSTYRTIWAFSSDLPGQYPTAGLIQGADGALYGVTGGGVLGAGSVFKINLDGSGFLVLHRFPSDASDGVAPTAALIQAQDGMLYGTTMDGGGSGALGTLFRLSTNGSDYAIIHVFGVLTNDGRSPQAGLLQAKDGALYGTTILGGNDPTGAGTLFRILTDGSGYTVLHNFSQFGGQGAKPRTGLIQAADGGLYGATSDPEVSPGGTIFRVSTDGSGFVVLHQFTGAGGDGDLCYGGSLLQGPDQVLYGTTIGGGDMGYGTIFAINLSGPPYVLIQPSDQAVTRGTDARFSVTASGGDLRYQWLLGGTELAYATDSVLVVRDVQRTNAGLYAVQITNALGSVVSSDALLNVLVPPRLLSPVLLTDGSLELLSVYSDGSPLGPGEVAGFEAQSSSNLVDWVPLTNASVSTNGQLLLKDPRPPVDQRRFYRVLQH
jgi:uncharacterized repeat protein (TIGR03803 family)